MRRRENETLEKYKSLHENRVRLAQQEIEKLNEVAAAKDNFMHRYHAIRDMKARKEAERSKLMEAARNDALATVVKAIYITAMEAECMMDENILLAEAMVDNWIDENGGAAKILAKNGNSTYLLSRITQIVEDAAEKTVDEIQGTDDKAESTDADADNSGPDDVDETASKDVQIAQLTAQDAAIKAKIANLRAEKKVEDEEEAESEDNDSTDDSEAVADTDDKGDGVESTGDDSAEDSGETEKIDNLDMDANDSDSTESSDKDSDGGAADTSTDEAEGDTTEETDDDSSDDTDSEADDTEDSDEESDDSESDDDDDIDADTEVTLKGEDEDDPELQKDEEELTDDEVDADEDASEDDDVTDAIGEPIDDDEESNDDESSSNGEVFDELDKEEDVKKAIEIIRTRVADAEETFIRNNAEDKKKINELLDKISNNVKTVEDLSKKDPKKAQVAQEAARENRRKIDAIYNEGTATIFTKMSRILTENIMKNPEAKSRYLTEDNQLDVDLVMESAKVMYGFLETVNTLQLEKVDEKYIANVLNGMRE